MLLGQAIRSFEIWLDKKAPYDDNEKINFRRFLMTRSSS